MTRGWSHSREALAAGLGGEALGGGEEDSQEALGAAPSRPAHSLRAASLSLVMNSSWPWES